MFYPPGGIVIVNPGQVDDTVLKLTGILQVPQGTRVFPKLSGPNVARGRTEGVLDVASFVPDWEWVAFIDADEKCVDPSALIRLIEWEKPIVSGFITERIAPYLCPAWRREGDAWRQISPDELPRSGLFQVDACGAGFLLIRREVFEALGHPWFRNTPERGEDSDFVIRAAEAGFRAYIDAGVWVGHNIRGTVWPRRGKDRRPWVELEGRETSLWLPVGAPMANGRAAAELGAEEVRA